MYQGCLSQGAIVCLCFPPHVPHMRKIVYRKVPLCVYGSHCKVLSCAKFPIARCHRVPWIPIAWCIRVSSCTCHGAIVCLHCPSNGAIMCLRCPFVCATMGQGRLPHGSHVCQPARLRVPRWQSQGAIVCQVSIARCHCVPSCQSQGGIVCHVSHRKVPLRQVAHRKPLCAKLPITRCHSVPSSASQAIACQVANHKVPLCAKLPITSCHRVPCCPLQGAIACVRCPSQAAIMWHIADRKVPMCVKLIMSTCHRVATLPIGRLSHGSPTCQISHLTEPLCAYVPHVKVPSCAAVTHCVCPLLCPKFSIA